MSLFPIISPSAAVAASVVYVGTTTDATSRATYTFTDHAIGTADATRKVVAGVTYQGTPTITGVTIGGSGATELGTAYGAGGGPKMGLYELEVAAGTTATIVLSLTGPGDYGAVYVWATYDAGLVADDIVTDVGDPLSQSLNIPELGVAVGMATAEASTTFTWAGLTENVDGTPANGTQSGASGAFVSQQVGLTVSATPATPTASRDCMVAASWGQA